MGSEIGKFRCWQPLIRLLDAINNLTGGKHDEKQKDYRID